jgi:type IV pilus assembly protein PilV
MNMKTSKGFTIIEVLVAMIILAIGVLGLGIMQITSLQNTQSGQMRSQASILAYDMIDSMRGNVASVTDLSYEIGVDEILPTAAVCYGAGANCTPQQMADSDIVRWKSNLAAAQPSGNGSVAIQVPAAVGIAMTMTVNITWVDPYSAANGTEQLQIEAQLPQ